MQELHWQRATRALEFQYNVDALLQDSAARGRKIREEREREKMQTTFQEQQK